MCGTLRGRRPPHHLHESEQRWRHNYEEHQHWLCLANMCRAGCFKNSDHSKFHRYSVFLQLGFVFSRQLLLQHLGSPRAASSRTSGGRKQRGEG